MRTILYILHRAIPRWVRIPPILAQRGNGLSLRLDALVLLEEFVEQHRVHGIVADAIEGAVGVGRGLKAITNKVKRPKQRFYTLPVHCFTKGAKGNRGGYLLDHPEKTDNLFRAGSHFRPLPNHPYMKTNCKSANSIPNSIELLEERIAPAVLVNTLGHKLVVKGDNSGDTIQIDGVVGSPTDFTVTAGAAVSHVTGITDIAITLGNGNDSVVFSNGAAPISISGSLVIDGGAGGKSVIGNGVTIGKNLMVSYGNAGTGANHLTGFTNTTIEGNLTVHEGAALASEVYMTRASAGDSTIQGNVNITNGIGQSVSIFQDMNIGGNVTITNGPAATSGANAGDAGDTQFYNTFNTTTLSVIKGNVDISYKSGVINYDGIWDADVLGNVTINHGSGQAFTHFDGDGTHLADIIRGNLSLTGTGQSIVAIGTGNSDTGLILGGALKIASGNGGDVLTISKLTVGGTTSIAVGDGSNTTTIDDSVFAKAFNFRDAKGTDTIRIDTTSGTTLPTVFEQAATIVTGTGGAAAVTLGGASAGEMVYAYSTFEVDELGGGVTNSTDIIFPFGGAVSA